MHGAGSRRARHSRLDLVGADDPQHGAGTYTKLEGAVPDKRPDYIRFIAVYEDGSEHTFSISSFSVQRTDTFAKLVARDRQAAGELPEGNIKEVRRETMSKL